MNSAGERDDRGLPSRWAGRPRPVARRYLLDLDLDLADVLDARMRPAARAAATATTFDTDAGPVQLSGPLAAAGGGPGVLALEGVVCCQMCVSGRTSAELLGAGDLVEPAESGEIELLSSVTSWRALTRARFAILDPDFVQRTLPWPQIGETLLRRAQRRVHNLNVLRAIACQPRLEVRLTLLLWHLASRWGRVEPGGIRLPLPLTHHLLGRLVGAERPSVSHALGRLSRSGVITGHGEEWHLHGDVRQHLEEIGEPAGDPVALLLEGASGSQRQG